MNTNFSAKIIAQIAIFTAISYIISFFEFPLFPMAPFLKLDFSNVFILIGGFSLGPIPGIVVLFLKEVLCMLTSQSYFVGQLANFLMGLAFVIVPTIVYKYAGLMVNRFINFPLYGLTVETFNSLFYVILAFNLIKAVVISILTILLYKRIKKLLKI